jgi:hypothetical protein
MCDLKARQGEHGSTKKKILRSDCQVSKTKAPRGELVHTFRCFRTTETLWWWEVD